MTTKKFKRLTKAPEVIASVKADAKREDSDARAKLEQKLGQLAYQIGKQSTKMNREQQILQNLQNEAN